jgi:tetratricopeptide (TPR) repeat protein
MRFVTAAAAVALIAAAVFYALEPSPRGGVPPGITTPIQEALEIASSTGLTVIPGGENGLGNPTSRYRSGTGDAFGVLEGPVGELERLREIDPDNRDIAYWLIAAYLATGQTDLARDYAREARLKFSGDADIATLYGLALYRDGDAAGAEGELRRSLSIDPENPVTTFNLGVALLESERRDDALMILEHVADAHQNEPIGHRARAVLAETSSH